MWRLCLLFFCLIIVLSTFSQNYSSNDRKAIELFEKALAYYNQGQLETAKVLIEKCQQRDKNFIESYLLLADIYHEQRNYKQEINVLKIIISLNPDYNPKIYYLLGKTEYNLGFYNDAVEHLNMAISKSTQHFDIKEAKKWLERAKFAKEAVENPVPFEPVPLSTNINTPYKDYWPSLTIDEEEFYYTIQLPTRNYGPNGEPIYQEDLYYSRKDKNNQWMPSKPVGNSINTDNNEGAQSISANGQYLFYVVCNRKEDFGSCDIYFSERTSNGWTKAQNIGPPINSSYWESTPAPSADGRMLFFSSGVRPDSKGGKDLYVSFRREDGSWTPPKNLGDSINTPGNEYAPFLHPDGRTLYFSSEGWPGMGGQDIFYSRMKDDSSWTTPKNLGYPINTASDDFGLIVDAKGKYAYFSSNREGSQDWDIYYFELYDGVKPDPVNYVKGKVYNAKTKEPVLANIEIVELESQKQIFNSKNIMPGGEYLACIPLKHRYAMNVNAPGYLFFSEHFDLSEKNTLDNAYIIDVPIQPIEPGATIVLKNIFYETDKFELNPLSITELNKIIKLLQDYPDMHIEISGHTDNVGSLDYNKKLSENRAKTVYQYLIDHGIKATRLKYTGYAYTKPIADNSSEKGRALNRRTELKIISVN